MNELQVMTQDELIEKRVNELVEKRSNELINERMRADRERFLEEEYRKAQEFKAKAASQNKWLMIGGIAAAFCMGRTWSNW